LENVSGIVCGNYDFDITRIFYRAKAGETYARATGKQKKSGGWSPSLRHGDNAPGQSSGR
jgi:hypothetical protein